MDSTVLEGRMDGWMGYFEAGAGEDGRRLLDFECKVA